MHLSLKGIAFGVWPKLGRFAPEENKRYRERNPPPVRMEGKVSN